MKSGSQKTWHTHTTNKSEIKSMLIIPDQMIRFQNKWGNDGGVLEMHILKRIANKIKSDRENNIYVQQTYQNDVILDWILSKWGNWHSHIDRIDEHRIV